jgi:hypothetical protein
MVVRVKVNFQHTPKQNFKKQRKIKLQHVIWESPRKNYAKKVHHRLRRSTTLLCHPELEGAFSAETKGVSITAGKCTTSLFLFRGPCERSTPSTPFPLRPSELPIFRTTEIPFAHCSHKYFSLNLLLS